LTGKKKKKENKKVNRN